MINDVMIAALPYMSYGILIHSVIDWLLQNQWQAHNKSNLRSFAGYFHAGLHFIGMLLIFPAQYALLIAIIHFLIDTRIPLNWWRRFYGQTTEGEMATHVAIWQDQILHWAVICVAALILAST